MAFTIRKGPAVVGSFLDPYDGSITVGGGAVTSPSTGAELLDLVRRWEHENQHGSGGSISGTVTYVEVAQHSVSVIQPAPIPYMVARQSPTVSTFDVIRARFVADKTALGAGDNPVTGLRVVTDSAGLSLSYRGAFEKSPNGFDSFAPNAFGGWNDANTIIHAGPYFYAGVTTAGELPVFSRSTDGVAWSTFTGTKNVQGFKSIAAGNGKIVAVDRAYVAGVNVSTDNGASWTHYANPWGVAGDSCGVVYNPVTGLFVAAVLRSGSNYYAYTSADGVTWAAAGVMGTVVSANDVHMAVLSSGVIVAIIPAFIPQIVRSADGGSTWTYSTVTVPGGHTFSDGHLLCNGTNLVYHSFTGDYVWWSGDAGITLVQATTGAATSFTGSGYNPARGKFILYSATDGTRRYTSTAGQVWVEEPVGEAVTVGVTVTQADIDAANAISAQDGSGIIFYQAGGVTPTYLTTALQPVETTWPPPVPVAPVQGTFSRSDVFYQTSGQISYRVVSFNGLYFNFTTGLWQATLSEQCKLPATYSGKDAFTAILTDVMQASTVHTFFVTGYTAGGVSLGTEMVVASTSTATYLQLQSGSTYLDFTTWTFEAPETQQSYLQPVDLQAGWFDSANTWHLFIADMPLVGPGQNPYVPPTNVTPVGSGGGDYINTGSGYVPAPSSPFNLLLLGGLSEVVAVPRVETFISGFSEPTAPPLPASAKAGLMEPTSSVPQRTFAAANTQHLGLPYETRG